MKNTEHGSVIRGKVIPEHRISASSYPVVVELDAGGHIQKAVCEGCKAQHGGCKHAVAFLFWLQRRSCERSTTDVKCYWSRPRLAEVPSMKPVRVRDMFPKRQQNQQCRGTVGPKNSFLKAVLDEVKGPQSALTDVQQHNRNVKTLSVGSMLSDYRQGANVIAHMKGKLSVSDVSTAEVETRSQASSPLWHHLRAGRLTASRIYEASRCQQVRGSLVESILGAKVFAGTKDTERGRRLEKEVIREVEKQLGVSVRDCGLYIDLDNPVLAASPDGVCEVKGETVVVEVKCPTSSKHLSAYLDENDCITGKVRAQMQLQMKVVGSQRGILCVADPDFERTKAVKVVSDVYDEGFLHPVLDSAVAFWEKAVFPIITASERGIVEAPAPRGPPVPAPVVPAKPAAAMSATRAPVTGAMQAPATAVRTTIIPATGAPIVPATGAPAVLTAAPAVQVAVAQAAQVPVAQAVRTTAVPVLASPAVLTPHVSAATSRASTPAGGVPVVIRTAGNKIRVLKIVAVRKQ